MNSQLNLEEPVLPLALFVPSPEACACLSESSARRLNVLPLAIHAADDQGNRLLYLACEDPSDLTQAQRLQRLLATDIKPVLMRASREGIQSALDKCFVGLTSFEALLGLCHQDHDLLAVLGEQHDFLARLVDALLQEACRYRASDIHVSPTRAGLQLRFRIDGVLRTIACISGVLLPRILVRLKVMASLDIAETRQPQDGQFALLINAHLVDFRVSTFPTVLGENTVIRVLDHQAQHHSLQTLHVSADLQTQLKALVQRPDGLLIVSGPTGSGKSTTLYALLAERDSESLNIMTLEDPVERSLPGIRQSNIDAKRCLDYSQGVRALLRQDPDVLLIGEVRDTQSCSMALRAVMTGHQIVTTVHARDAIGALSRLLELGATPELLADHLAGIVSQRLLRKLCTECTGSANACCTHCHGSGYWGRQVVMEVLQLTPELQTLAGRSASTETLHNLARSQGFVSMREHADALVRSGITDTDEVTRVLGGDILIAKRVCSLKPELSESIR